MIGRLARRWKDLQGVKRRTRRARLKGWRLQSPNTLSAHLISGASYETLWRSGFAVFETWWAITRAPASQTSP